jgi:hypothetical protein
MNNPGRGMLDIQVFEAQFGIFQPERPLILHRQTILTVFHFGFSCRPLESNRRGTQWLFLNLYLLHLTRRKVTALCGDALLGRRCWGLTLQKSFNFASACSCSHILVLLKRNYSLLMIDWASY